MKVSFIQFDVKKDKKENLKKVEEYTKTNDANLIVLPELSSSWYLFENREELLKVSESINDIEYANKTNKKSIFINSILEISKKYSKAIIAGFAESFKDKIYNSALIAENGIFKGVYRKVHLSDFEKKFFYAGDIKESYNVFEVCKEKGNGITALPVYEQVFKIQDEESTREYIPREELRILQTPQAYHFGEILAAYKEALERNVGNYASSYANTMMTELGKTLYFSKGSTKNIKITTKDDIEIFKAMLLADKG